MSPFRRAALAALAAGLAGCSRPSGPPAAAPAMSQAEAEREVAARIDVRRLFTNEFVEEAGSPDPVPSGPPDRLRLGLLWLANDQATPWFVGLAKGFFRDAGIDLQLVEGGPGRDNVPLLIAGRIDLFEGNVEQAIEAVFNPTGADLVMICANAKRTALCWVMLDRSIPAGRRSTRQVTAADLRGRRIGLQAGDEDLYVNLVCAHFGLAPGDLTVVPAGATPDGLIAGAMDFYECFADNQIRLLERQGYRNTVILPFSELGYVSYADATMTRRDFYRAHRDLLRRYVAALRRSLQYVIGHPDESAAIAARMSTVPLTPAEVRWRLDRDIPAYRGDGREPLLAMNAGNILTVAGQLYRFHQIELPPPRS